MIISWKLNKERKILLLSFALLQVILITFKIMGITNISWFWVMWPTWFLPIFVLLLIGAGFLILQYAKDF